MIAKNVFLGVLLILDNQNSIPEYIDFFKSKFTHCMCTTRFACISKGLSNPKCNFVHIMHYTNQNKEFVEL